MIYLIADEKIKDVCKMGQGFETCRYLTHSTQGWECMKLGPFREYLDRRAKEGTIKAQGDNCEGEEGVEEVEGITDGQRYFLQVAVKELWARCEEKRFSLPNGEWLEQEEIDDLVLYLLQG